MTLRPGDIDVGSEMQITGSFTDQDGEPLDPETVAFLTRSPCGTETTYTYGVDAAIERASEGEYIATFVVGEAGTWEARWQTATPTLHLRERFNVRNSWFDQFNSSGDYV